MAIETRTLLATIASGQALSGAIHLELQRLFALQMPGSWTAADLTFEGSYDGTTYAAVYDESGAEVTVDAAASRFIILDPAKFLGLQRLKIRSGTSGSPVNQGGDREIAAVVVS